MKKYILLCSLLFTAVSLAQPPNNFNGLKICVDPGHGGNNPANDRRIEPDPGNVFWESEGNFRKALWLRPLMQQRGATVFLTRETNTYPDDNLEPSLSARWQFANANNVHWFHSIHSNAGGGTYTMVLIKEIISTRQPAFPAAVDMSAFIYSNIRSKLRTSASGGNIVPGVYKDYTFYGGPNGGFNLGVLNGLVMPGQLSEGSFHDGFPETRRLLNNDYRKTEAYGIMNGFVEYYKIPYDTLGMIIGFQKNGTTPINNVAVHLLPVNKVYNGDTFNNGFYLFDSLPPGSYKVVYETTGFSKDTVNVTLNATGRIVTPLPANNATGVDRSSPVVLTFIKPMDTAMVRSVFSIVPSVEGSISWNAGLTEMTFTPKNLLAFKTSYTITLAGLGNTVQPTVFVDNTTVTSNVASKSFVTTFQTTTLPPYVQLTQPVPNDTNFTVTQAVGIRFSESMDTASVRNAFSIVPATSGTFTWSTSTPPQNTLLWKPVSGALEYATNYSVTIGSGAKSIYNKAIDGNKDSVGGDQYSFQFRTQLQPVSVTENHALPFLYSLDQNYPNPFNPSTSIAFSIAQSGPARLSVYDMLGREVKVLFNGDIMPGMYTIQWDASGEASGMYIYRLTTDQFSSVKRMLLVK